MGADGGVTELTVPLGTKEERKSRSSLADLQTKYLTAEVKDPGAEVGFEVKDLDAGNGFEVEVEPKSHVGRSTLHDGFGTRCGTKAHVRARSGTGSGTKAHVGAGSGTRSGTKAHVGARSGTGSGTKAHVGAGSGTKAHVRAKCGTGTKAKAHFRAGSDSGTGSKATILVTFVKAEGGRLEELSGMERHAPSGWPGAKIAQQLQPRLVRRSILDRKGLMGWVCLSVCHASTAALGKP